ncbi:hypothetical protein TWF506_009107 [Arthrobotrys conoides]|uniref:Protein kinase domain-containing protein n=1 Tax=Arthrobotrys conoides TaxID=74498 RepID=A0AAN8N885_9PEZI
MAGTDLGPNDILWDDLFYVTPQGGVRMKEQHPILFRRFMAPCDIFEYKGFAIKYFVEDREIELTELAGDCSVKIYGHILKFDVGPDNESRKVGLVMEIGRSLQDYVKQADEAEKHRIKDEMIAIVERLHKEYNMVHGDIKPQNFLICNDGKIRFCDFEAARPLTESLEIWEGLEELALNKAYTYNYINKMRSQFVPPTEDDDWYALAISIWEIFTGKVPFEGIENEEIVSRHSTGQTVDLTEVKDIETREWIRDIIQKGGALV